MNGRRFTIPDGSSIFEYPKPQQRMILLDDNFSGIMASWVQAACAVGTIILGIVMFSQKKRIEELTDVVLELRNQTKELKTQSELLAKRYELEDTLSLKKRIPYFEQMDFVTLGTHASKLMLQNRGVDAYHVGLLRLHHELPIDQIKYMQGYIDVHNNDPYVFEIITKDVANTGQFFFELELTFLHGNGNAYTQLVRCVRGIIIVEKPTAVT